MTSEEKIETLQRLVGDYDAKVKQEKEDRYNTRKYPEANDTNTRLANAEAFVLRLGKFAEDFVVEVRKIIS